MKVKIILSVQRDPSTGKYFVSMYATNGAYNESPLVATEKQAEMIKELWIRELKEFTRRNSPKIVLSETVLES